MINKLETSVPGLDVILHGGIPEGRATLLVGKSGTGKTGTRAILLAAEESPEDARGVPA
jgi:KaiC/GvpD/RAD55 family RecA-like ATPase